MFLKIIDKKKIGLKAQKIIKIWGCIGNRQVLFENRVQQRLSMSRNKRLTILFGDISLEGLDIDWHLAEYDYSVELPIGNDQPAYAYAA